MLNNGKTRRWIVALGVIATGGICAGAVIAAQVRGPGIPQGLEAAIEAEPLVLVADLPARNGQAKRGVFVQPTSAGFVCLWDAPSASSPARQGGCNPSNDPFAGRELFVNFVYDGGPAVSDVRDARLSGLVSQAVARAQVVMSDGTQRSLVLRGASVGGKSYRGFGYRLGRTDLQMGVGPIAVVALDESGAEIDRQTTGFNG